MCVKYKTMFPLVHLFIDLLYIRSRKGSCCKEAKI